MRSELLADLLTIARGQLSRKRPATAVTPVTDVTGYRSKPLELQALHRLQVKNSKLEKGAFQPETKPGTDLAESVQDAIEERVVLCAGCVPAIYLAAWARLNHQKPMRIADAEWQLALDDGGRFFDAWAWVSETEWAWTVGELFDVPRAGKAGGLIWRLCGALVEAYGPAHVRLSDGRIIERDATGKATQ